MKKVLKNLEPWIRPYLGDAFCFSTINDIAFESGWVYDKYIHLEFTPQDGHIKYAGYDYYDFVPDQGLFIKSYTQIPFSFCTQQYICELIMEMIDDGEYFFALWDENVVTNFLYNEDQQGIFEHGCFVYGYDSERETFYSQGYLRDEKWKRAEIPYSVFYRALSYYPEKGEIAFIGYKPVENYSWTFDFEKMKEEFKIYQETFHMESNRILDAGAEKGYFENLLIERRIHYPSLYCMYEHKKNMVRRMEYLIEKRYISEADGKNLLTQIQDIESDYKKIMLFGVKYILNQEKGLLEMIYIKAMKTIEKEKEFIFKLLESFNAVSGSVQNEN